MTFIRQVGHFTKCISSIGKIIIRQNNINIDFFHRRAIIITTDGDSIKKRRPYFFLNLIYPIFIPIFTYF